MSLTPSTTLPEPTRPSASRDRGPRGRLRASSLRAHHLALAASVALSAVMNTYALSQNGWANGFYSAGVKSMLGSLHNFLFVSSDPGGLISIDKPPLSMWLQVASARLFGFTPLSVLLPEAICGVACVIVLYLALVRPLGRASALSAALCLAVFPAFVAISRDNNPDALLIVLMTLACLAVLKAIDSGRLTSILLCGLLVGLAFNVKTLAAWLVVPPIALAYVLCARGSLRRRLLALSAAGLVMAIVSLAWLSFVDLTPASKRPWVGSSRDNSELSLTFAYNGFGRLDGEAGGPGATSSREGAYAPLSSKRGASAPKPSPLQRLGAEATLAFASRQHATDVIAARRSRAQRSIAARRARALLHPPLRGANGRSRKPMPFAQSPGVWRLFGRGLGGQAGWLLPLAIAGVIALAASISAREEAPGERERAPTLARTRLERELDGATGATDGHGAASLAVRLRHDPRLPALIVFGGWLVLEAVFLSVAKGIVHPYYASALGPGTAAMAGAALPSMMKLARRGRIWQALLAAAITATVFAELTILDHDHFMRWFSPLLIAVAVVSAIGLLTLRSAGGKHRDARSIDGDMPPVDSGARPSSRDVRSVGSGARSVARHAQGAFAALLIGALLCAPAVYSAETWDAPVQGTFPVASPWGAAGYGGVDTRPANLIAYRLLLAYLPRHELGSRFSVLTVSSVTSASLILMGSNAASLAGYSGTDPAVSARRMSELIASGQARYVLLGGPYSSRGGNGATKAALAACPEVPPAAWDYTRTSPYSFALLDCKGKARALAAAG